MALVFGSALASHLARLGWSQRTFARRVGASQSLVARVINGSRKPPLDTVAYWIASLDLPEDAAAELARLAVMAHGGETLLILTQRPRAADRGPTYAPNRSPGSRQR